ncbi:MAG: FAD-binding domain-containing protein, partial [Pseudomonadota bacterium]
HNHARMWYASIWIFTLGLPWQLGADLFLRNLIDGDPASNTLGWRWVAGLHTRGKHYLARPDNIAKYTSGRFRPKDLNTKAGPLKGADLPKPGSPPRQDYIDPSLPTAFLLTEEDLSPGYLLAQLAGDSLGHAALLADDARSDAEVAGHVTTFTEGAIADASARWADKLGPAGPVSRDPVALARWAEASGASQIVAPYTPTGPAKTRLKTLRKLLSEKDIQLITPIRDWDRIGYPRATHGFFRFKDVIPDLLDLTRPDGTGDLFARAS